jgi:16S rRNA (cytosine967-C5)-methyltransferase
MSTKPKPSSELSDDPGQGLAARIQALALIEAGLSRRGGFDEAMASQGFKALEPTQRAWARGLAATVFRRLGAIDAALSARMQKPPPPEVTALLRIGAAQILYRDTPDHAAVSTTVSLADRKNGTRPFKPLINAVLRKLAAEGAAELAPECNLPPWLYARWRAAFGPEIARDLAALVPDEPPTDLTLRDPAEAAELAKALEAEVLPGGSLRTRRRGELPSWPGFAEGRWWVQDFAAAIPARLLEVKAGETALDLCAAPGGKTLQLLAAGAETVAIDRSAARLKRLRDNLARMGFRADAQAVDALLWKDKRLFDAILLDAPCSATGTFRRHPDVLWGARPGDVAKLSGVQAQMLDSAAERLKPGGRMVYCVCSLEPEEGEAQVKAFLARRPDFSLLPIQPGEAGAPAESVVPEGLRLLPVRGAPEGGMDGFFVARFIRNSQTAD